MRKIIITIMLVFIFQSLEITNPVREENYYNKQYKKIQKDKEWKKLIQKIVMVESSGGKYLVGDNGKAIGPMQIHKIMVDEVNRIIGKKVYTYKGRWHLEKSIEMFNIYQSYWNPDRDIKRAAMLWNCGSNYPRCSLTELKNVNNYWRKIKRLT